MVNYLAMYQTFLPPSHTWKFISFWHPLYKNAKFMDRVTRAEVMVALQTRPNGGTQLLIATKPMNMARCILKHVSKTHTHTHTHAHKDT